MSKDEVRHLLSFIYWFAIGSIQMSGSIRAFAKELHRLADCLEKEKSYKPDLNTLGWPT